MDWIKGRAIEQESDGPISPETRRILTERLKTIDRDEKESVDARQVLADIRKNLKHPVPR